MTETSPDTYAAEFLQDSLGLAVGTLSPDSVPAKLRETIARSVRGENPSSPDPVVDEMANEFAAGLENEAAERSELFVRKARWPSNAPLAVCLTHDVDTIHRPLSEVFARRKRFSTVDLALALLGAKSLYDNLERLASTERERGFRSSYYFLSSSYDLKRVTSEMKALRQEGWETGLHGDFGTHDSAELMRAAMEKIRAAFGEAPKGAREHYLRFDFDKTWEVMEKGGLDYDTTVGNRDSLGFRIGISTPFHPPDRDWRPMRLTELPLSLMDTTLWGYLKLSEERGLTEAVALMDRVARSNGLFTLLWHQESLLMKGGRIYPRVLQNVAGRQAFVGSGAMISEWWRMRGGPLVRASGGYEMDAAPNGLTLLFRSPKGGVVEAEGGVVQQEGQIGTVKASGGALRVRVAK